MRVVVSLLVAFAAAAVLGVVAAVVLARALELVLS